jgi:hypothetical protein
MRALFERITNEGEAAIRELCDEQQQETLMLEFKTKESPDRTGLTRTDSKNLGEALSGFSNSAGGLLIWGVKTQVDAQNGIDVAQSLSPISSIENFKHKVSGLVTDYLMPQNDAIEILSVPSSVDQHSGYLLMLIEPSELRPHMSRAPGHHRYYRRSGDKFFRMEHYEIQDMFNRISPVKLDIFHRFERINATEPHALIYFGIWNNTRLTAKYPYLHIIHISGGKLQEFGPKYDGRWFLPLVPSDIGHYFRGGIDDVLNPDRKLLVFGIEVPLRLGNKRMPYFDDSGSSLIIDVQFGCENSPMREQRIELTPVQLSDIIDPHLPMPAA